ncbi:helix-turn-helix transcriptional regulator [Tunicatimonas pelagia]|uniref:helix-turn-helix transcriptional regulator n=1 Tax=Tunicatimonas pelagia TaxID=931531 RepID=UPI002666F384|nr:helix-turn-helix transcriptional regulator [Tunicatimonas pelagia]WKN46462.1 helix-turn-helix transcriptional regulator [Tunicatimonas pelagia]
MAHAFLFSCAMENQEKLNEMVGSRIRQARLNLNYTQSDVAERVEIDITHYSRIERGKSNPSLLVAYRICQLLQISLDDLFTD